MRVSEGLVYEEDAVERRREGDRNEDGHGFVSTAAATTMYAHGTRTTTVQSQSQSEAQTGADRDVSDASPQAYYFTGEEDLLRLAGEGVFSPAVSMPPPPLTQRMQRHALTESDGRQVGEEIVMRRRVQSTRKDDEAGHI